MNWKGAYAVGIAVSMGGIGLLVIGSGIDSGPVTAVAWGVLTLGGCVALVSGTVLFATGHWNDDDLWVRVYRQPVFPRIWAHLRGATDEDNASRDTTTDSETLPK